MASAAADPTADRRLRWCMRASSATVPDVDIPRWGYDRPGPGREPRRRRRSLEPQLDRSARIGRQGEIEDDPFDQPSRRRSRGRARVIALHAAPALACGGLIGPNGAVNLLRTTTLAGYHDGAEHYVTAFQFAGGGGAFGSLTPLPGSRRASRRAATGRSSGSSARRDPPRRCS
jgi:hypothetical protein